MADGDAAPKRKRNAARTSADILRAAALAFSHAGYAQAGIREIAASAGINAALVMRYYGSKENLFSAALTEALDLDLLIGGERSSFGKRAVERLSEDGVHALNPTSMIILSTADPVAKSVTERLLDERTIKPLQDWLGPPSAEARAALITVLCTGFVIYRKLLPLAPLGEAANSDGAAWLAKALQALADGEGFGAPVQPRKPRAKGARTLA